MASMFDVATAFNGDVSSLNTTSVTPMDHMFYYAISFDGNVSSRNTTSVTSMVQMFLGATAFNGDMTIEHRDSDRHGPYVPRCGGGLSTATWRARTLRA